MNWDTVGYSKDKYRISLEENEDGFVLIRDDRHHISKIALTHEEAGNLVRFLSQAEQARIDQWSVRVYDDE